MQFPYLTKTSLYFLFIILILITIWDIILFKSKVSFRFLNTIYMKEFGMKYILLWTPADTIPFVYMGKGQKVFIDKKCPYTNCVVSNNAKLLVDPSNFDVIAFAAPQFIDIMDMNVLPDPRKRLQSQKYVFVSIESSYNYPLCSNAYDGYFNWTWTYKLDSDLRWGYIVVRDSEYNIIGPNKNMHWLQWNEMSPTSDELKLKLKSKTKAAAWFVSNCLSASRREGFVHNLRRELRKYKLAVDIYGNCGPYSCPRDNETYCYEMISRKYYFYLSFENAFSEDYVTEKLLIPLQNNAIPIVYGGANYSRFLPHGSYLNARQLGIYQLAKKMSTLIQDPEEYAKYFKWKNHYSYHKTSDSLETNEYCRMCAMLNDDYLMEKKTVYDHLHEWWDPPDSAC